MNNLQEQLHNQGYTLMKKAYFFAANVTVASLATGQINFQVDSSYDYVATGWSYKSTGIFNVQFYDNEQKIFYDYIPCEVFNGIYTGMPAWGDRHWNGFPPNGYLFRAKSNINIHVQDTSVEENTIKLFLKGFRVQVR